jgi:hypothetical protein
MELLKSLLKPLFKYYKERIMKLLLPTLSTSMAQEPYEEASRPKHGKKNTNLSLHGVVLVEAHVGARDLQDYSHTPSGPGHIGLDCDSWNCSYIAQFARYHVLHNNDCCFFL